MLGEEQRLERRRRVPAGVCREAVAPAAGCATLNQRAIVAGRCATAFPEHWPGSWPFLQPLRFLRSRLLFRSLWRLLGRGAVLVESGEVVAGLCWVLVLALELAWRGPEPQVAVVVMARMVVCSEHRHRTFPLGKPLCLSSPQHRLAPGSFSNLAVAFFAVLVVALESVRVPGRGERGHHGGRGTMGEKRANNRGTPLFGGLTSRSHHLCGWMQSFIGI